MTSFPKRVAQKLMHRLRQYWYPWIDKRLKIICVRLHGNFVHSVGITVAVAINNERPSYYITNIVFFLFFFRLLIYSVLPCNN